MVAELALGLDVHLPDASVLVEVVYEGPSQKSLEGLIHGSQGDTLLQNLVAIHFGEELRHARQQGREEPSELRSLPGGGQKSVCVLGEERGILAGPILQDEGDAAGRANAGNRRR